MDTVMFLARMHREDVKAIIRRRFGSLAAFERAKGLSKQSVSEVFRGRPSGRTTSAIERVLKEHFDARESIIAVDSAAPPHAHRINGEAR